MRASAAWARALGYPVPGLRKYRNILCQEDGYEFDSIKELKRYRELKLRAYAREIQVLEVHPKWDFRHPITRKPMVIRSERYNKSGRVLTYEADFSYYEGGELIVEDVKSKATNTYPFRVKMAMMEWLHGIKVRLK